MVQKWNIVVHYKRFYSKLYSHIYRVVQTNANVLTEFQTNAEFWL